MITESVIPRSSTRCSASVPPGVRAAIWASPASNSPTLTWVVRVLSLRQMTTSTVSPTGVSATMRGNCRISGTSLPSNSRMTSPASISAVSAGPSSMTLATRAPLALSSPKVSAISSVTVWM